MNLCYLRNAYLKLVIITISNDLAYVVYMTFLTVHNLRLQAYELILGPPFFHRSEESRNLEVRQCWRRDVRALSLLCFKGLPRQLFLSFSQSFPLIMCTFLWANIPKDRVKPAMTAMRPNFVYVNPFCRINC